MASSPQTIFYEDRATTGRWKNFSTGETLVTVKQPWGIIIVALGGIWLSWAVKYLAKIFGNAALFVHSCRYIGRSATISGGNINNTGRRFAKLLKEKRSVRDLIEELVRNKTLNFEERILLFFFILLIALVGCLILFSGYCLATMKLDGPARLASDRCGLWVFDGENRSDAATRASLGDLEKEERAAQFATDCYLDGRNSISPLCNRLYLPRLPVSKATYTNDCPFRNEICRFNQSVTFKTGTIDSKDLDSKDLGFNTPSPPKFRHRTTCTPLSMEYPYVQNRTINGTTTYYYYYGAKPGADVPSEYTYKTVGNPWDRLAPVYDVFAYSSSANNPKDPVWVPREELQLSNYSTLTIIFVSSLRILYKERSDDAIFPADLPWTIPGDPRPWFRNSDPRARPLACINTIEVCTADPNPTCWNMESPSNSSIADDTPDFTLLYASLYKADIYFSMAKRQGRSLLAQKRVSQYFSEGLGDDPWVAEVQNLVFTALARAQINAWSVATGEDSVHEGHDGYISLTEGYGDLCGRFIYNPKSYHTFLLYPFVLVACTLPGLWVLSWDWNPIEQGALDKIQKAHHYSEEFFSALVASIVRSRRESQEVVSTQTNVEPAVGRAASIEAESLESTTGQRSVTRESEPHSSSAIHHSDGVTGNYGTFSPSPEASLQDEGLHDGMQRPRTRSESIRASNTSPSRRASGPANDIVNWEPLLWFGILRVLWRVAVRLVTVVLSWVPFMTVGARNGFVSME